MKKYNEFINEELSVRDAMKPKSNEEIQKKIAHLSTYNKMKFLFDNKLPKSLYPNNEEIIKWLNSVNLQNRLTFIKKFKLDKFYPSDSEMKKYLSGMSDSEKTMIIITLDLPHKFLPKERIIKNLSFPGNSVSIPNNLTVIGDLDCSFCSLKTLPSGLNVGGDLHCRFNELTEMPNDLIVNGNVYCDGNKLSYKQKPKGVEGSFFTK